jgi:predicted ferric reductase
MLSDQFFWFATRSAGLLTWLAATGSVGVGLLMSTRVLGRKPTIPWLLDVHRYLSAVSIVFLVIHLITLWVDDFIDFGPAELFIPGKAQIGGLSSFGLALGVIAMWLLFVIEASSLIKDRLPKRHWHTLHLTSFGVVILGLVHGIQVGSDSDNRLLIGGAVSMLAAVLILTIIRGSRALSDRKLRYQLELDEEEEDDHDHIDLSFDEFDRYEDPRRFEDTEVLGRLDGVPPPERWSYADEREDVVLRNRTPTDW